MLYSEAQAAWVTANRVKLGTRVIYERVFVGVIAPGESSKNAQGRAIKQRLIGKECIITGIGAYHLEIDDTTDSTKPFNRHFAPFYVLRVI